MPSTLRLSEHLYECTTPLHRQAERSGVMRDLLARRIDRMTYVALIRNLLEVYRALELGLERYADHPCVRPIHFDALRRVPAITCDIETLYGSGWSTNVPLLPAGLAYASRIRIAAADSPATLAAHAYVRYLGDLSGGQALRSLVARALDLPGDDGTRFYCFAGVEDLTAMKDTFRRGLDSIPIDDAGVTEMGHEARLAFHLNIDLFEAITAWERRTPASAG